MKEEMPQFNLFDDTREDHVMCAFFDFFGWVSSNMGVFLTVAMTVDRSLAIQFPLKAPTLCTVKRAQYVTGGLFLLEVLKDGHLAFTSRVVPIEETAELCEVDKSFNEVYEDFYDNYWPYINNISLIISFVVIIIGNIIITMHVKRSEDSKDIGEGSKTQSAKGSSKSRQLSVMLIIDSASVIICTLPFSMYVMLHQSFQLFDDSPEERGKQSLVFAITFYLLYVNRCANFFLYCLSGARFRNTLKEILCRKPQQFNDSTIRVKNTRGNVSSASSVFTTEGQKGGNVCTSPANPPV
ncbi:uncharacterized protein LOC143287208 [Babylonia areolata]|uniref:uncharacterized protein LOC143287208 n=1 Tax=Babylonia areolata TaxID=304850 RepID=UPI003FCF5DA6